MSTTYDDTITAKPGETVSHIRLIENESGTAQDLSGGWTGRLEVRAEADDTGTALITVTSFTFTAEGLASCDIAVPTSFTSGTYVYDVRLVDPDGDVIATPTARFIVPQNVTKPA